MYLRARMDGSWVGLGWGGGIVAFCWGVRCSARFWGGRGGKGREREERRGKCEGGGKGRKREREVVRMWMGVD